MRDLPSGTVTFLFTDIEGSTRLLHELGDQYPAVLAEHRRLLRDAFTSRGGIEVDTQGDAFFYAFPSAKDAVAAAGAGQEALADGRVRVRMGLHTGEPFQHDEGYAGLDVHRAARIASAAHGGQVLLSRTTRDLVDVDVADLGEHRLKDLSAAERIYQLGEGSFPPLKTLHQTNLPIPVAPFLGRERELGEIGNLLEAPGIRLVTLTGPGGSGKTRLALQAAGGQADRFPDGVWWVPLAALRDPALVLETAAHQLGAKQGLAEHIGDKRLLLLFDNFEHVADAAADVAALLASCPNVVMLVTSREPLHVAGEQEYAVEPLRAEEAVELFVQRARAVRLDFIPRGEVEQVCLRLDCLPLAVELAAARVKALALPDLLARLDERLPLLAGGARDAPERQRTLRATIEWSYDLLTEEEQRQFVNVGVFAGGWTLDEAELVAGAEFTTLEALVDKSLVRFSDGRYWMFETIREFAATKFDQLPDGPDLRRGHAAYFRDLADQTWADVRSDRQLEAIPRAEAEVDNFRAALVWAAENEPEWLLEMAGALGQFWFQHGHAEEGRQWLSRALADPHPPSAAHLRTLTAAFSDGLRSDDPASLRQMANAGLEMATSLADLQRVASFEHNLGHLAMERGNRDEARAHYERMLAAAAEADDEWNVIGALGNLGILATGDGDYDQAWSLISQAVDRARQLGERYILGWTLVNAADVRRLQGRGEESQALLCEALELTAALNTQPELATVVGVVGSWWSRSRPAEALWLLAAATAARDLLGVRPFPDDARVEAEAKERCRIQLGHEAADQLWDEGLEASLPDAVDRARQLASSAGGVPVDVTDR